MTGRPRRRRRGARLLLLAAAGLLGAAGPAGAAPGHVEPEVAEAPAASRTTFSFVVEHGCGESPTTEVAIEVPEGSFDLAARPPTGWSAQVIDQETVVVFQGGPLDAETPETFAIELVTPDLPGVTVLFPTVQTCVEGEIAWIDPDPDAEEPAPRLRLTENPNPVLPTTTTPGTATTAPPGSSTTTELEIVTSAPEEPDGGDGGGGAGTLVYGLVAALLVVGFVAYRRRS